MNENQVLWSPNNGIVLPKIAGTPNEILIQDKNLLPREKNHIHKAFANELYDMALEYTWTRTFSIIKNIILKFGDIFVLEMLGRTKDDSIESVSEVEIIRLAADLGVINETAKMKFLHLKELIDHYSSRKANPEEEIDGLEALTYIKVCVQYVLGFEDEGFEFSFNNFRNRLKLELINSDDELVEILKVSPYFYKKTTMRTLLNLLDETNSAEWDTVFQNMLVLIPEIWGDLLSDDRYPLGFSYSEAVNSGEAAITKALKTVLLKVRGFDYVPEDLRSRSFIEVANRLLEVHYNFDNFYNEPSVARQLESLGTIIPGPAISPCVRAVLACKIGNRYGTSSGAQIYLDAILEKISPEKWKSYFDTSFKGDEDILYKLMEGNSMQHNNFTEIVRRYNLIDIDYKSTQITSLINAANENRYSQLKIISTKLYKTIRGLS